MKEDAITRDTRCSLRRWLRCRACVGEAHAEVLEHLDRRRVAAPQYPEQEMLGPEHGLAERLGLLSGELHRPPRLA